MNVGGREMSFLEHIEELRWVLVHSAFAVAIGTGLGWWLAPRVLDYVVRRTVGQVVVLGVMEPFNETIRMAIILGLGMALPYVLYRVWTFVVPGLFQKERAIVLPLVGASLLLFLAGVAFSFYMVVPAIISVLRTFVTPTMRQNLRLSDVLGFVYNMCIACGILFQLPLVTLLLSWAGLVTPHFLLSKWRHAIVVVLFITAIITPGDVATAQIFLGIPIIGLYFLSIAVAFVTRRKPKETAGGSATRP
jgi:sec-independent protein translocase protein TatC